MTLNWWQSLGKFTRKQQAHSNTLLLAWWVNPNFDLPPSFKKKKKAVAFCKKILIFLYYIKTNINFKVL